MQADGMIFAVAAAPEIPMPEQWMPWFIQQSGSRLIDSDVDELADTLMNGLRAHLDFMRQGRGPLDSTLFVAVDTPSGARPSESLVLWLNGLLQVHKMVEPVWQSAWQHLDKKLEQKLDKKSDKTLYEQGSEDKSSAHAGTENSAQEAPEVRLSRCLKMFSTLANVDLALKHRTEEQAAQLNSNLTLLIKQLPAVLQDYIKLAGELAGALPNQFEMFNKVT
jgi:hypothetical protein